MGGDYNASPTDEAVLFKELLQATKDGKHDRVRKVIIELAGRCEGNKGGDISKLLEEQDDLGWTLLHFACHGGTHRHAKIVALVCQFEVDVNVQDNQGWTPLHVAAQFAPPEALIVLLNALADPSIEDDHGQVAYDCASSPAKRLLLERPQLILEQMVHTVHKRVRRRRRFVQLSTKEFREAEEFAFEFDSQIEKVHEELGRLRDRRGERLDHHTGHVEDVLAAQQAAESISHELDEAENLYEFSKRTLWCLRAYDAEDVLVSAVVEVRDLLASSKIRQKTLGPAAEALSNAIEKGLVCEELRVEFGKLYWADDLMLHHVESLKNKLNLMRFATLSTREEEKLMREVIEDITTFGEDIDLLQGTQGTLQRYDWLRRRAEKARGCFVRATKGRGCASWGCQDFFAKLGF
eukprot:NODE_8154_length_1518_cov_6.823149.p1 GENE.NODE_8154_length_1518_cov_6.823149~~NODE_8154_length_1518_cov_6.823149.p1  ORF type:complete len:408 (+),score=138.33 NODE_8154_length_1518_cov_6.823149:158-1381(+)